MQDFLVANVHSYECGTCVHFDKTIFHPTFAFADTHNFIVWDEDERVVNMVPVYVSYRHCKYDGSSVIMYDEALEDSVESDFVPLDRQSKQVFSKISPSIRQDSGKSYCYANLSQLFYIFKDDMLKFGMNVSLELCSEELKKSILDHRKIQEQMQKERLLEEERARRLDGLHLRHEDINMNYNELDL